MENHKMPSIPPELMLAAAIVSTSPQDDAWEHLPSIEDISLVLFRLKNSGIPLGDIALRRVPEGFYSEDIEAFIGDYLAAGYATQRSPVKLTERGRQALAEIISEERRENTSAVEKLEAVLGKLPV